MRTVIVIALCAGMLPCLATAGMAEIPALPSDSRIKLLPYDESDVYTIATRYGYQTSIVFAANEEIATISVGDRTLWQIIPSANRLFIRPMQEGVITNMTVLTSKRSYQFDLVSLGVDDKDKEIVYVARFVYPDSRRRAAPPVPHAAAPPPVPHAAAPPAHLPPPSPVPLAAAPTAPNYNYTYSGPDRIAPLQVFDNGAATFIKYHAMPDPLPEIYAVDADGRERPVARTVQDNLMVVNAITGTLALKSADGTILVYNEMLNPQ